MTACVERCIAVHIHTSDSGNRREHFFDTTRNKLRLKSGKFVCTIRAYAQVYCHNNTKDVNIIPVSNL